VFKFLGEMELKALILAAGEGKRIKVIGDSKPLVSLLGLRLIERVILTAKKVWNKRILYCSGLQRR